MNQSDELSRALLAKQYIDGQIASSSQEEIAGLLAKTMVHSATRVSFLMVSSVSRLSGGQKQVDFCSILPDSIKLFPDDQTD